MSKQVVDTLLLVALPASGKSEVRTYLSSLSEQQCREEMHLGATVQLDDFPYVHFMRRIDEELGALGEASLFFRSAESPFQHPVEWDALIGLLNEDYADLHQRRIVEPASAARYLFERLERARDAFGGPAKISKLSEAVVAALADKLEAEAAALLAEKHANYVEDLDGKTIVIEFARGGPQSASMPLPPHYGYRAAFSALSEEILSRSSVLYIWVTPEESRRKNAARADPDDPGSILHHGVPIDVMLNEYGCDDMDDMLAQSSEPNTVEVETRGKRHLLKVARFDNRVDKTSFIREPRERWSTEDVAALHQGLSDALAKLV